MTLPPRTSVGLHGAGLIAAAGALIHVAAIAGGPAWFEFFGAPPAVMASARAGTWLAPVGSLVIASLMALCAAYAFSALGHIRPLPLQRLALLGIASVCLLRASTLPLLAWYRPELINTFELVASAVWGAAGVGFALGWRELGRLRGAAPTSPT